MGNYSFLRLTGEPAVVEGIEGGNQSFNLRDDSISSLMVGDFDIDIPGRAVTGLLCNVLKDMGHYTFNSQGLMLVTVNLSFSENPEDTTYLEFVNYFVSTIRALLPTVMKMEQRPFAANKGNIETLLRERYASFVRDLPFERGAVGLYKAFRKLHERRPNEDTQIYLERSRRVVEIIHYLTHLPDGFTFDESVVHPNGVNPISIPKKVELQL